MSHDNTAKKLERNLDKPNFKRNLTIITLTKLPVAPVSLWAMLPQYSWYKFMVQKRLKRPLITMRSGYSNSDSSESLSYALGDDYYPQKVRPKTMIDF